MRGVVTLQIGLGLAALFGAAYLGADRLMAPVETAQLVRAARAEATAVAQQVAHAWSERREAARSVVLTMAETPALKTLGRKFSETARTRGINAALDGVVVMAGAKGQAVLLDSDGEAIVERDGADSLVSAQAAKEALRGRDAVIVEEVDNQVRLISAAPILSKGDVKGALLLALPLRAENQRTLLQQVPTGVTLAVQLGDRPVFGTLDVDSSRRLAKAPVDGVIEVQGREYRGTRLRLGHDGQASVSVLTLAALDAPGAGSAAEHLRFIIMLLGLSALLVAIVVLALNGALGEVPAETVRLAPARKKKTSREARPDASSQVTDLGYAGPPSQPLQLNFAAPSPSASIHDGAFSAPPDAPMPMPMPAPDDSRELPAFDGAFQASPSSVFAPPEGAAILDAYGAPPTPVEPPPPTAPPPPEPPEPPEDETLLADSGIEVLSEGPASEVEAPLQPVPLPPSAQEWSAESPMFNQETLPAHPAPGETPPPGLASELDRFALEEQFDGVEGFGPQSPFEPPQPGGNFKEPTPFEAIRKAAFSAPPPPASPPEQRTDLPTPKGPIPPEIRAAQRAEAQRRAYEDRAVSAPPPPTGSAYDEDLPIPKDLPVPAAYDGSFYDSKANSLDISAIEAAASALPPPTPVGVGAGRSTRPVPLPGSEDERDPWRNPSVPKMKAVQPPAGLPSSSSDPSPYDEEHYRSVYQEFVASKEMLGESVANLSYDGFRSKLRNSEESLLDRHGCRAVRFQVLVKDRTVSLRPQLVR